MAASGDGASPNGIYPAFSPNVLAVGGTSLFLTPNPDGSYSYSSESGWRDSDTSGSGGGSSQVELAALPAGRSDLSPNTGCGFCRRFEHGRSDL